MAIFWLLGAEIEWFSCETHALLPSSRKRSWLDIVRRFVKHCTAEVHSFIHSGYFYSASLSSLLLRGAPDYSFDTVLELTCRSATGPTSEGLAQCSYMAASVEFESARYRIDHWATTPQHASGLYHEHSWVVTLKGSIQIHDAMIIWNLFFFFSAHKCKMNNSFVISHMSFDYFCGS